jgi:hypothetical protein
MTVRFFIFHLLFRRRIQGSDSRLRRVTLSYSQMVKCPMLSRPPFAHPNWRGSKRRIVLRRRARRVDMDDVLRRIEIEMADARSWLSLGSLRIGVDNEIGIRRLDRITVAFQVRRLADKPSIQKSSLSEGVKISIRAMDSPQLQLCCGNGAQRLDCEAFIRGADSFRIDAYAFGG